MMAPPTDCTQNTDPLKLVREGTRQDQRMSVALDPAYAPVDEHTTAHQMVFAQAYSAFLRYCDSSNVEVDDWRRFFSEDVSVQMAIAAVQDIEYYKSNIKTALDFLNNFENKSTATELKNNLGYLFSYAGALAKQLDSLKESLPPEIPLKGTLQNLIASQLAPAFKRLIAYYKGDLFLTPRHRHRLIADEHPNKKIMGSTTVTFEEIYRNGLSKDWITDTSAPNWSAYTTNIEKDSSVYGTGLGIFVRINHIATHTFFTSIFDQFLKVYARVVSDAKQALNATFTQWDRHEPHYTLFLTYLRLFEYARAETNTLTGRHLDFYYREILQLKEKSAEPGHAHLLVELAKHADPHQLKTGELFKAGKDDLNIDAFFANDRDLVANQAKVTALKTMYRHGDKVVGSASPTTIHKGRVFASLIANSADGLGAALTTVDQSWHPFSNKIYADGELVEIRMAEAEVGFAIASHYLWMAEGTRTITLDFTLNESLSGFTDTNEHEKDVVCLLTSKKGWLEAPAFHFEYVSEKELLQLKIELAGTAPAITPYSAKTHGYAFATNLPILLVKLRHCTKKEYIYPSLQDAAIKEISLRVEVDGLKTLAVSNDFGPVDTAKPFQPYGASPVAGNSLIIGSKEAFQKQNSVSVKIRWVTTPTASPSTPIPGIEIEVLNGDWERTVVEPEYKFVPTGVLDEPDFTPNEFYNTASRHGFIKLSLVDSFGQSVYQTELLAYPNKLLEYQKKMLAYLIKKPAGSDPGSPPSPPVGPPVGPTIDTLSLHYTTDWQQIKLDSTEPYEERQGHFFHLAPFGQAEKPSFPNKSTNIVYLLPQFDFPRGEKNNESEAELYIGVTGLKPPQNLALLFQVIDGTADPLLQKPDPHIHWSYLRSNEWVPFAKNDVEDHTGELLNSGIVTFAMPRDATCNNTILPDGMHWIRAAVTSDSDAVCRLHMVAAQALEVTFMNKGNDPAFPAKTLVAGTISKLDQPVAAIKKIIQPFATFGGQEAEAPKEFYTRISERLRHKDRAIALWDYERLILEAFPQIYQAKCLNHTQYTPDTYKELAPGHVTVVTIPSQQFQSLRDPLRPYTSLGLLEKIETFLGKRFSCFVKLHVRNPQFEEVRTEFNVRLYDGFDETFYVKKLKETITRFLSPWAYIDGKSPSFGGKIYKSVLINLVEEQPYVDYVTDFKLFHVIDNKTRGREVMDEVEGSKAVSILVSVPATEHDITAINPTAGKTPGENCPCET